MKKEALLSLLLITLLTGCIAETPSTTPPARTVEPTEPPTPSPAPTTQAPLTTPPPTTPTQTTTPAIKETTLQKTTTTKSASNTTITTSTSTTTTTTSTTTTTTAQPASAKAWMDIELRDVATQKTFTIGDFKGQKVLLESFAVWCPKCTAQQQNIKTLRQTEGHDTIHIALNTDPNEDEAKVKQHIERYGFDWYYAISSIELSNALIDEFGLVVVNAPSVPKILICEDQETRFLPGGTKSPSVLEMEIDSGC